MQMVSLSAIHIKHASPVPILKVVDNDMLIMHIHILVFTTYIESYQYTSRTVFVGFSNENILTHTFSQSTK